MDDGPGSPTESGCLQGSGRRPETPSPAVDQPGLLRPRDVLAERRQDLVALAERHGLHDPRLFGSVARGTDHPGSDIDLLVRVPRGTGLLSIAAFALEAEQILGMHVDVVTEGAIRADHPILAEAVAL